MAETNEISSLYPPPPPYIKFFTQENLEKLPEYLKTKTNRDDTAEQPECALDFLIPPPLPPTSQYRAFGSVWQLKDQLPDLKTMGLTQLYNKASGEDTNNYQYKIKELHRLLKSLLLNYLELVNILSIDPTQYEQKVDHIRTILVNIHHLLNEYRPHQSRESLIMLLEEQVEYKRKEIKEIDQVCQQLRKKLANLDKPTIESHVEKPDDDNQ
ncbi:hypothetical protein HG537_0E02540 [Torulaspora globosa]|uniref:Mediator of RNA polymerase II transcription subunit 7 n=1 Tax=Torulaspora globosa TaxID=48254 RepID=A0A7H9HUF2_9SACH|nr:hypothetical protein HG537_0E02540 [Torulaspora sp. CBS 2947]